MPRNRCVTLHALLPDQLSKKKTVVTPEEFVAIAGPNWREKGLLPICPCCGEQIFAWAPHSPRAPSSFHHRKHSTCPLSSNPDPRYSHLRPSGWDFDAGARLKAVFCEPDNLRQGYAVCHRLCKKRLKSLEFVSLCREADRRNVWAYRQLPLEAVPYILVTLMDFLEEDQSQRETGFPRTYSYRFVLQKPSKASAIDAMWLRPENCRLQAVFADSGKPVAGRNVAIYAPEIEDARMSASRVNGAVFDNVRKCCAGRPSRP